jgi:NTP pyrophosphatase (non-canonical NTP hydrolase)
MALSLIFPMTLKEIQSTVDEWINNHGVRYFSPLTNTAILAEEVGEVASLMARIYGDQSFKSGEDETNAMHHLSAELADVLFVLVCLANQSGTDLSKAFQESLEKKTIRDKDRHRNNKKLDNKSNP